MSTLLQVLKRPNARPRPSESKVSSEAERCGLFPLNEKSDASPHCKVDMVAIHGLGGHYLESWTDRQSDGRTTCWLKDFIPKQFGDRVRILSFGYDSRTAFTGSVNTIEDTARGLLTSILHARATPSQINRPLIFICHSLGGVIFKKALVIANENTERFANILDSTNSAMLFGVPHRGSSGAFWGSVAASILHSLNLSNPHFVKALRSKSISLQALSEQSVHRLKQLPTIMTFYESSKTDGQLVVDKDSAVLHVPNENSVQISGSNHITICKFADYESQKYRPVRSELQNMVDRITQSRPDVPEPSASSHRSELDMETASHAVTDLLAQDLEHATQATNKTQNISVEPYSDNPISRRALHFVARESIQDQLESHFKFYRGSADRPVVALIGMGGAGKTQIAIEYCRIRKEQDESLEIFWIDASSPDTANQAMMRIAKKLLPNRLVEDPVTAVSLVQQTLSDSNQPWLMVYDNLDRPSEFEDLLSLFPISSNGSILVTSRDHECSELGRSLILSGMEDPHALRLLLGKLPSEVEEKPALEIIDLLGRLPLAIDQARGYIAHRNLPLEVFLQEYGSHKRTILGTAPRLSQYKRVLPGEEKRTALCVITTWEMSFSQLESEAMRGMLTLLGFFHPSEMSEPLLTPGPTTLEPYHSPICSYLSSGEWNHTQFRDDIATMQKLSLLQFHYRDDSKIVISIHSLISEWLRIRTEGKDFDHWLTIAMLHMANYVDTCDYHALTTRQEALQHVTTLSRLAEGCVDYNVYPYYAVAFRFGTMYSSEGRLDEAERMYDRALSGCEVALGPNHRSTLNTVNQLGLLYTDQGRLDEAERLYNRALAGCETVLGPNHTSTLNTVNNLGSLYAGQGRLEEAERMYYRALAGSEIVMGPNHTSTLSTLNNLGAFYAGQGRLEEAERMYDRALAGYEMVWGSDHTSTLRMLNNLGALYAGQGRLEEAEILYDRALAACELRLGPDHTSTLNTVINFGNLYNLQGRLEEAERMFNRALAGFEIARGPNHASTLNTVNNLGILYKSLGRLEEAERFYNRALSGKEIALGPKHMSTLDTVDNLGLLYVDQGRLEDAERMYDRALAGKEGLLGPNHASTLNTMNNLGSFYAGQERMEEAERMYDRALAGYEILLGPNHTSTLNTVNNLGALYASQGRLDEAERMYDRALAGYTIAWGPKHTSTLKAGNNLVRLYEFQRRLEEAERMYNRLMPSN